MTLHSILIGRLSCIKDGFLYSDSLLTLKTEVIEARAEYLVYFDIMAALPQTKTDLASNYSPTPNPPPPSMGEGVETENTRDISHDMYVAGWREAASLNGRVYYFNMYTRHSVWNLQDVTTHQREQQMLPKKPKPDVLKAAMTELGTAQDAASVPPAVPMVDVKGKMPSRKRRFEPDPDQAENDRKAVKFPIGGERFVAVKLFKGLPYVNIREYYWNEIHSKMLAGKKGLNLTEEQWHELMSHATDINNTLSQITNS